MLTPPGILTLLCTSNWYCPLRSRVNHIFTHCPCALIWLLLHFWVRSSFCLTFLYYLTSERKWSFQFSDRKIRSKTWSTTIWLCFFSGYSILARKEWRRPRLCLEIYTIMLYCVLIWNIMLIFCMHRIWLTLHCQCSVFNVFLSFFLCQNLTFFTQNGVKNSK